MKPLENAIKMDLSSLTNPEDKGFCHLCWSDNYYNHCQRMPINVVDKILEWRDKEYNAY